MKSSRITKKFEELKSKNKRAFITYITAGDPSLDITYNLVLGMEGEGVDIVELGIPYADPLADGPVIQNASQRALKAGTNITKIFQLVKKLREKTEIPIVFLVYFNSIFKYGFKKFLDNCSNNGVDGLIIPDLPLEERRELQDMMKDYSIDLIPLVAPTSKERIEAIVESGSGFVYCISSMGVTGTRDEMSIDINGFSNEVKKHTELPLALGFGISTPEMVKELSQSSDGLIVGSAIIKEIELGIKEGEIEKRVFKFVKKLSKAQSFS
ncbi:MAG: tryptophan synthase subunit alpha [Tissierellia bacterium]|nr:tryptophan synthase subunit alpha [Tissierellia bacterium]